jgi:hypothetical protein
MPSLHWFHPAAVAERQAYLRQIYAVQRLIRDAAPGVSQPSVLELFLQMGKGTAWDEFLMQQLASPFAATPYPGWLRLDTVTQLGRVRWG